MLQINNAKTAKKSARALEKFMARSGVALGHGKALEAIAVLSGFKDWNSMAQATSADAMDAQLDGFELSHIEHNQDVDYGHECAAVVHTGFELRYSASEDLVDYVRVCDPLGREIAYWNSDEWQEDPQVVMGAILGALMRGRPQLRGNLRASAAQEGAAPLSDLDPGSVYGTRVITEKAAVVAPVRIEDVPIEDVSNVLVNGVPYSRRYYDSEVLGLLYEPAGDEDAEGDCHHTVLELVRNEDGLEWDESVSLAQLRSMTWSDSAGCFKSADGDEYVFFTEQRFSPTNAAQEGVRRPVTVTTATPVPAAIPSSSDSLKLYYAEVYARGDGNSSHLGTWLGLAVNPVAAREAALGKLWDARLDGAGCLPEVKVEEEVEDNHAPFTVRTRKGVDFKVESIAQGVETAKLLIERTDHQHVSLVNGDGEEILVLTR